MTLILDASVALKWVLDEDGSDDARQLIGGDRLAAPDFLLLECANVLAMKVRTSSISALGATRALSALADDVGLIFYPSAKYVRDAQALAMELERSAYDCLYLALALAEGAVVVTADAKFARVVQSNPAYERFIKTL